jgi:hypothetical protein
MNWTAILRRHSRGEPGYGAASERDPALIAPDFVANDAPEAVRWLLER